MKLVYYTECYAIPFIPNETAHPPTHTQDQVDTLVLAHPSCHNRCNYRGDVRGLVTEQISLPAHRRSASNCSHVPDPATP
jgi:hypothetical protein